MKMGHIAYIYGYSENIIGWIYAVWPAPLRYVVRRSKSKNVDECVCYGLMLKNVISSFTIFKFRGNNYKVH